jgi:hypothetical protein
MDLHDRETEDAILSDRSLKLYEALTLDSGLQHILNTAGAFFNNPILISDISFKLIAHTGGDDVDDSVWKQIIETGYFPSEYIRDIFKNDAQYQKVFGNALPLLLSDSTTPNRFMTKMIVVKGKPVGFSTCLEYHRKITQQDMRLFDVFCKVVGSELRNDENIRQIRSHQYEYFISELLSGAAKTDYIDERLKQVGLKLKKNLYVLVAEFSDEKTRREYHMDYFKAMLEAVVPDSHCIVYNHSFVLLICRNENTLPSDALNESISRQLENYSMVGGLSHRFCKIEDMSTYYMQACEAISLGRRIEKDRRLFTYGHLSCYHLLKVVHQTAELKSFCNPNLLDVIEYDNEFKSEYAKTAYVFLQSNLNPVRTAKRLNTHRNTVDYRIKRLDELFGIRFDSREEPSLNLSFSILRYLSLLPFACD